MIRINEDGTYSKIISRNKKALRRKAIALLSCAITWITGYKLLKDSSDRLHHKYTTTYETYNSLTGESSLSSINEKGNEEEVVMRVYPEDTEDDGIRQVDAYYFKKDETMQLTDYMDEKDKAIRCEAGNIDYSGTSEGYTEVQMVKNVDVLKDRETLAIIDSLIGSAGPVLGIIGGWSLVEAAIARNEAYEDIEYGHLYNNANLSCDNNYYESNKEKVKKLIRKK